MYIWFLSLSHTYIFGFSLTYIFGFSLSHIYIYIYSFSLSLSLWFILSLCIWLLSFFLNDFYPLLSIWFLSPFSFLPLIFILFHSLLFITLNHPLFHLFTSSLLQSLFFFFLSSPHPQLHLPFIFIKHLFVSSLSSPKHLSFYCNDFHPL